MTLNYGSKRLDLTLQPVSGRALPVQQGEILRLTQMEEGGQCVDFNAFNLHDHKEHMEVGAIRSTTGFRPKKTDIIFSNPPRYRPMLGIIEMPPTCVTDILGRACHATLFEARNGFEIHTNCQDTLAECIAEYGLTPDDVHASFNIWMYTEWDSAGRYRNPGPNPGRKGDHVDLLAVFDILAVPATCGSDVVPTNNYSLKPIQVEVYEASKDTSNLASRIMARAGSFRNQQRVPKDFRVSKIRAERELEPVPNFKHHFINYPLRDEYFEVDIPEREYDIIKEILRTGFGTDEGDVVRRGVMGWCTVHRARSRDWAKIPLGWL